MRIVKSRIAAATVVIAVFGQLTVASAEVDADAWIENIQAESDINALARMYLDLSIRINPPTGGALGIHARNRVTRKTTSP